MTEVKICGITNLDDGTAACDCGADAVGFIFFKGSHRYVSPEKAREIILKLPKRVAKVGVFVNEETAAVRHIYESCGLDLIQLHGNESAGYCRLLSDYHLIKALHPPTSEPVGELDGFSPLAFLVDSGNAGTYGGTGNLSDWKLAEKLARRYPVVLAGGLNPGNVEDAIRAVSPAAVDVGSGVESEPGKKDHSQIGAFMEAVRGAKGGGIGKVFSGKNTGFRVFTGVTASRSSCRTRSGIQKFLPCPEGAKEE